MRATMSSRLRKWSAGSALAFLCATAAGAATLEGRWKLVEQRYGTGGANLASIEAPVRLEFYLEGPGLAGRIWVAGGRSKALPWPAFVSEDGAPLPVQIQRSLFGAGNNLARAEYRVALPSQGGEVLEIVEVYRVLEGGAALTGTVTVTSLKRGKPQGAYLLHRRFEREP